LKKIIQNPIKFVYSFTLNSKNEPILEETNKFDEDKKIEVKTHDLSDKNKNNIDTEKEKAKANISQIQKKNREKNLVKTNNILNINIKENNKNNKFYEMKRNIEKKQLEKPKDILQNNDNKFNSNDKIDKIRFFKEKNFINKKRINDNSHKEQNDIKEMPKKNNSSKFIKNSMIHQIYNSKNINLWEDEESDSENNDGEKNSKIKENKNILPIHKQIEFIHKCKNEFSKHDVAKKSEYDKDLDKGRVKKIHKNKIGFKKHKNYFQKISNKQLKKQNKNN
jgi:hypothetical protein